MNIEVEVSRPHYHPGKDFDMVVTKKRDLSVPPHWVANERITNPDTGKDFAIVMPPRDEELYELRQPIHIHIPLYVPVSINGKVLMAKIKPQEGFSFEPKLHIDSFEAEELGIKGGERATLL